MKTVIIIGIVLIAAVGAIIVYSSSRSASTADPSSSSKQSMDTVESDMKAGALLLDVRTPEEYSSGYIQGATNLPLSSIETGTLPAIAKETKIYVYCRSGNRSAQAKSLLEKSGFTNINDLGGMSDVISIGGQQTK